MPAPIPASCRERFLTTATLGRQHVVESGDPTAPLILLLHGFPEFWYSWRHQLEALAADFHVVAADMRGYGQTDKPATGYDIFSLAADVDALLAALTADDVVKRPVTLVGHDWGGVVAWSTMSLHPGRIDRFVAIDAPHPLAYLRSLKRNPAQLFKSWYIAMFQIPGLMESRFAKDPGGLMARILRSAAVNKAVFSREEIGYYAEAMAVPGALTAALAYYRNIGGILKRLDELGATIAQPTLVLWGAEDPALGTALVDACRSVVTGSFAAQIFAGAGHWLQQEKAAEVSAAIGAFAARMTEPRAQES